MRRRTVKVDGLRINVREAGPMEAPEGRPTIVLVHGFIISSRYMRPLARLLAERGWRVVAPDLPGYGLSEGLPEVPEVPTLADWLGRILDAIGERRPAVVLGNSAGCQFAVELAIRRPELVDRLVLLGPTFDPAAGLLGHVVRLLVDVPRERPLLWVRHVPDYVHAGPARIVGTLRSLRRHRIELALPSVSQPVLVARGSRDPIAPSRWVRDAARLAQCGRAATVPGAPHAANYSTPERLLRVVEPFLGSARGRTSSP